MKTKLNMFAIIALLVACRPLDDADDTYSSLYHWYCLDEKPEIVEREPGRVTYVMPVVDFNSQPSSPSPVPDVTMRVCTNAVCMPEFPLCDGEPGQCYNVGPGPAPFVMVLDFPYGFVNGILRFQAPDYVDMDYVLGGPMIGTPEGEMQVRSLGITMVPIASRDSIYAQVGVSEVDPDRGTLALRTLDCRGQRASGVLVSPSDGDVDDPAVAFSLSNNNLATPTSLRTDERGVAGFINLAPQTIDVIGLTPGGEPFVTPTTLNVRSGVITLAELRIGLDVWGQ